jgi:hypothetical protein
MDQSGNKQEPKKPETIFEVLEQDVEKLIKPAKATSRKMGKVVIIIPNQKIIVDVDGNGEEIPFDPSKHSNVKVGDEIEVS